MGIRKSLLLPLLVFIIATVIFCLPLFGAFSYLGQMDWDQFTFWNAASRITLLRYHQFPLWNPYVNGGNVLLAHPHSSFLSPLYILVLLFGSVAGLKLQVMLYLFFGLIGMYLLSVYKKLSRPASYLTSFVFMLCSVYVLHMTEGHASWMPMALIPWFFLLFLKSIEQRRYIPLSVIVLGLIAFAGSVDVFAILVFFVFIYALFSSIQERRFLPLGLFLLICAATFLVCAVKLLPMLEFLRQSSRTTLESSGMSFPVLCKILLSRSQDYYDMLNKGVNIALGISGEWHEYGAYIGILPLALGCIGAVRRLKADWPLILTGAICLLIVLSGALPFNLWNMLSKAPVYNALSCPSRFIVGFIFSFALLAGFGFDYLRQSLKKLTPGPRGIFCINTLFLLMVLFVFFDLFSVNSRIFKHAFVIPPAEVTEREDFQQRYGRVNLYGSDISRSSVYPIMLSNSGILDGYEVLFIKRGGVEVASSRRYKGEAYLADDSGIVTIDYFSPNKIVVTTQAKKDSMLVLNQNYYSGWWVVKDGRCVRAEAYDGLIATKVSAGKTRATFFFLPISFLLGAAISISTITAIAVYAYRARTPR
ncbi:MAG: hypothetical protein HQ558_00375 [Candidatus Omnitrophica bacterium]|nr:hypothetical protein [Candidatus Omnitrophota bacterium]